MKYHNVHKIVCIAFANQNTDAPEVLAMSSYLLYIFGSLTAQNDLSIESKEFGCRTKALSLITAFIFG